MDYGENTALLSVAVGLLIFGWAIHIFSQYWKTNQEEIHDDDKGPTSKGPP
jgi:hypothetical protein